MSTHVSTPTVLLRLRSLRLVLRELNAWWLLAQAERLRGQITSQRAGTSSPSGIGPRPGESR